jgi:hypothetical protein
MRVEHRHPMLARRAALEALQGECVVFLDADDVLPPDYLELGVPLFQDRHVGIVYSDMQEFGERSYLHEAPQQFDAGLLERMSFIHAGAIASRMALEVSMALDGPPGSPSGHDWRAWRRVIDAGFTAAKSDALYQCRRRPGWLSRTHLHVPYYDRAGLGDETVTVFIHLSGRDAAWESHLRPWLDGQTWPRSQMRLVLADTSRRDDFHVKVRQWVHDSGYPDVRLYKQVVGAEGLNGRPRPNDGGREVNMAMRRIYARMARELQTASVLVVEDDHRPPPDAVAKLLRGMDEKTAAVSGIYRGRSAAGEYVCWSHQDPGAVHPAEGPAIPISGSGFGAVLIRRGLLKEHRPSEAFIHKRGESYPYDIGFAQRVTKRGGTWKLARDVLSEHYGAPPLPPPVKATPPPALDALAVVSECPHAKLCCCEDAGKVECQPGGRRSGETLPPAECRKCLGEANARATLPSPPADPVTLAVLAVLDECPHASPVEGRPGFLACGPGGRRAGGQSHHRDCRHCLTRASVNGFGQAGLSAGDLVEMRGSNE